MNPSFFQYLIFASNIFLIIILSFVIYFLKKESEIRKSADNLPEGKIIKKALIKSDTIIGKAVNYAQEILSVAQNKRLNLISGEKLISKQTVDNFRKDIEKLEAELRAQFAKNTDSASTAYQEFMAVIEKKIQNNLDDNRKMLEGKASQVIDSAGKSLNEFTLNLEKNIKGQIENEMNKAKAEIDEYKTLRKKVLDEKIVDILEEILTLTVAQKLSLSDRSAFIYKALEEAKKSHALE